MLDELKSSRRIVGLKRVTRSIENDTAKKVFLAEDVSPNIYEKIVDLCKANNIEIEFVDTMKHLGAACKIDVGSAVASILK